MHQPVMVSEVVRIFDSIPSGVLVDATCGGGGHSLAIWRQRPDLEILGLDRDSEALERTAQAFGRSGGAIRLRQANSDQLSRELRELSITGIVGFLMDLGVSSQQLDTDARGFSFHNPGPLDMRMDAGSQLSAQEVVNSYSQSRLTDILRRYGQERFAKRIAAAIVRQRPIADTGQLAQVITAAIPARYRRTGKHPARRSFQAIRIEVNQELEILERTIPQAIAALKECGRGVFISYHSGEDIIVKRQLRLAETGGCECPPQLPCQCGAVQSIKLLHRKAKVPAAGEVAGNFRARSARLRSFEKLGSGSTKDLLPGSLPGSLPDLLPGQGDDR